MALDLGFYDQSHFTRIFRQFIGITPAVFRTEHTARKNTVSVLAAAPAGMES